MSYAESFDIGYLRVFPKRGEELFVSVSPAFNYGPGIERDGLTLPRMRDPHTVEFATRSVCSTMTRDELPDTDNAHIQRAGTWTLFDHVREFCNRHHGRYRIIGVQSCGDLTMNPWHIALIRDQGSHRLCRLATPGVAAAFKEPIDERSYRCLVRWTQRTDGMRYEFIDLRFVDLLHEGFQTRIDDQEYLNAHGGDLKKQEIDPGDITCHIDFALSGKPIVQRGREIALPNVIDRFQDVRHVFNLPRVPAYGARGSLSISEVNFGEHILFTDLNARRGALSSPIVVPLYDKALNVEVRWDDLQRALEARHYRVSRESPTTRGEYRRYGPDAVEIFYPHNVYPFGVLGGNADEMVCLSSGGLSGRVGNTLEGITTIMYDFFGCSDALVLDEGYDTFHITNPNPKSKPDEPDNYLHSNDEMLEQVARFTLWRALQDADECRSQLGAGKYLLGNDMWEWPLNKPIFHNLSRFCGEKNLGQTPPDGLDTMCVEPKRSQVRAALIFAKLNDTNGGGGEQEPATDPG